MLLNLGQSIYIQNCEFVKYVILWNKEFHWTSSLQTVHVVLLVIFKFTELQSRQNCNKIQENVFGTDVNPRDLTTICVNFNSRNQSWSLQSASNSIRFIYMLRKKCSKVLVGLYIIMMNTVSCGYRMFHTQLHWVDWVDYFANGKLFIYICCLIA